MKLLLIALVLVLVTSGSIGASYASSYQSEHNPKLCTDYMKKGVTCYQYEKPTLKGSTSSTTNWQMDIFAPDFSCNIFGFINQASGSCSYKTIILSDNDFQNNLKRNISVLAVVHIQQTSATAQDYCPVAIWTWNSQDVSFKAKYNESLVIPASCVKPIPEFTLVNTILAFAGVMGVITLMRYK